MSASTGASTSKDSKQSTNEKKKRLYITNLPAEWILAQVRSRFETYGTITDVRLYEKPEKRFAFVEFAKGEDAAKAIAHYSGGGGNPHLDVSYARDKQSQRNKSRQDRKRELAKELIKLAAEDLLSPKKKKKK